MPAGRSAQHRDQGSGRRSCDVADGGDPPIVQLRRRRCADSPHPFDRERVEEGKLVLGRHDEEPIGLGDRAGHLGQELGPRHSDRDPEAHLVEDVPPQLHRDLGRGTGDPPQATDVEECLVDRETLDPRRRLLEDPEDGPTRFRVGGHPRLDDDGVRTQPPGLPAAHRRAHPAGLGLVAGGEHDSHPDDDRAAAQPNVVTLLDGRVEGIEVGVQDGRRVRHEHMFAQLPDPECAGR